jgi:hypothetical protein
MAPRGMRGRGVRVHARDRSERRRLRRRSDQDTRAGSSRGRRTSLRRPGAPCGGAAAERAGHPRPDRLPQLSHCCRALCDGHRAQPQPRHLFGNKIGAGDARRRAHPAAQAHVDRRTGRRAVAKASSHSGRQLGQATPHSPGACPVDVVRPRLQARPEHASDLSRAEPLGVCLTASHRLRAGPQLSLQRRRRLDRRLGGRCAGRERSQIICRRGAL